MSGWEVAEQIPRSFHFFFWCTAIFSIHFLFGIACWFLNKVPRHDRISIRHAAVIHMTRVFICMYMLCICASTPLCVAVVLLLLQSCFLLLLFVMVCGMTHFVDMDYELPLIPVVSLCSCKNSLLLMYPLVILSHSTPSIYLLSYTQRIIHFE